MATIPCCVLRGCLLFPRKRSSQSSLIQRVLAASTRRTACILFDGVCVLCSRGCGFVNNHDRRAYFRIVPMQLAEARDLVQSIGSEHTSAAVSNIALIPGGQKRTLKVIETPSQKRSVFSSSCPRVRGLASRVPSVSGLCISVRQWSGPLGHWSFQPLDRRGTPRASSRPGQQCRTSPQGA